MSDQKRFEQSSVERILEDESLTADLLDPAARILLDWGVARAEALATRAESFVPEELDTRLADLRRTLKRVARQAGAEATPEAQIERVRSLLAEIEATAVPVVAAVEREGSPKTRVATTSGHGGKNCANR